jgi:AraC-like DNA-binding protein
MTPAAIAALLSASQSPPAGSLEGLLEGLVPLGPLLDVIPNAAIFIKDDQARYRLVNRALVERCGARSAHELLGKTSAQVFPAQLGPSYTAQDEKVLRHGVVLDSQLELHLYGSREPGWCLTHKWPLLDQQGTIMGLTGISVDLQTASQTHPAYERLAAVDTYIRQHFDRSVAVRELARIADCSVAQLERYCKRIFQLTPRQMIQKARLEHAHRLLQTALPIVEVALRCGYTDHSAFTRQFKALTGFSPRQYRQAMGLDAGRSSAGTGLHRPKK